MTTPTVAAISSYLAAAGWHLRPETWRGASLWTHGPDHEVLVPAHDGMRDRGLRVSDLLEVVAAVEQRPQDEIERDIVSPPADIQSYKTHPDNLPRGMTTLAAGVKALEGVRDTLWSAARAVVEGPHTSFAGKAPTVVRDLLERVQLAPARTGSYVIAVRVPLHATQRAAAPARSDDIGRAEDESPLARQVTEQMHDAVLAASAAVSAPGLEAFDDTITAGVSSSLCFALSRLAGADLQRPFEVEYRWAPALRADVPSSRVAFPGGSGEVLRRAGRRLQHFTVSGEATVTGLIHSLVDDAAKGDRWRVNVRGDLTTDRSAGSRRSVWVRLVTQAAYDGAVAAHLAQQPVTATGPLASVAHRVELHPDPSGLRLTEPPVDDNPAME